MFEVRGQTVAPPSLRWFLRWTRGSKAVSKRDRGHLNAENRKAMERCSLENKVKGLLCFRLGFYSREGLKHANEADGTTGQWAEQLGRAHSCVTEGLRSLPDTMTHYSAGSWDCLAFASSV